MYAVVGCSECDHLWLLSDPRAAETATCPRCGRTHRTKKLRRLAEDEDREAARQARAALLAKRGGNSEAFAETAHVAEMESRIDDSGVDDREYLEGSGLDADAVASAGERAPSRSESRSRDEVVRDAIREQEAPTAVDVTAYAESHGVPGAKAEELLERLARRGEVAESNGTYRLL
ncbi:DUF5817 domain-containing protein [Halobellus ruber]|uniref:Replication protein H n=1 Tax=Halobellus ruber TaxID=2761102 RepID=A0A7J9SDN5_9EURY|nr:DUF5817 domain-containing protein [Halobellus ruber]MBB6644868.1 replication protein H [Halobellus ruber]